MAWGMAHTGLATIAVGTSGYAYTEWIEAGVYPPATPTGKMLALYAGQFGVTELNYTWYQMPRAEAVERQRRQVPETFGFAAKLTRTLTHDVDPRNWPAQAAAYREGIAPLLQARQLIAVLIQLPPSFDRTSGHRRHLAALLDALAGLPLAVEFRHRSWATDRVFAELQRRRVTLVSVDVPDLPHLFPALDAVTNPDLFYLRFHGRNARGWRSGNLHQQFDYDYSREQLVRCLEDRVEPLSRKARRGVVFFNNHVRAQAVANARQLIKLIKRP
jgi:uncharacterized protein YecE (DUF72 family)